MERGRSILNNRVFLHRILAGDGRWIHYDNAKKRETMEATWLDLNIDSQYEYSWKELMGCIYWDQICAVYYELFSCMIMLVHLWRRSKPLSDYHLFGSMVQFV